jgi:hypothetical protein
MSHQHNAMRLIASLVNLKSLIVNSKMLTGACAAPVAPHQSEQLRLAVRGTWGTTRLDVDFASITIVGRAMTFPVFR